MMSELLDKYEKALAREDISELQNIISALNTLSPSEKKRNSNFYEKIGDDLFERSIKLPNYSLSQFKKAIQDANTDTTTKRVKKIPINVEDDFASVFVFFYNRVRNVLQNLKCHFWFLFENANYSKTEIVIITDETFKNHPLIRIISTGNGDQQIEVLSISDFIERCQIAEDNSVRYLCLLAVSPQIAPDIFQESEYVLAQYLSVLNDIFNDSQSIIVQRIGCDITNEDYSFEKLEDRVVDKIHGICTKVFNNKEIGFEEEIIIKDFFENTTSIIDYKVLKGGFSGSKVIEVQPLNKFSKNNTARFVIKYALKDDERKVSKEYKAFKRYIDTLPLTGYRADYSETNHFEAIRYTYASSDAVISSYSFADIVKASNGEKAKKILKLLFNCPLLSSWNNIEERKEQLLNIYKEYINEEKLLSSIALIEGESSQDIERSLLWLNFRKIITKTVPFHLKVCHGDLHSENFFYDDKDVFLIDFGYTGQRHSLIDHTTLEASIKFKHVPFYIPTEELILIEEKLLDVGYFNESADLSFIKREELRKLYELILIIRYDSMAYTVNKKNILEYLLSLFVITMRQIQYKDLNQRFAFESAKVLASKILKMIDS